MHAGMFFVVCKFFIGNGLRFLLAEMRKGGFKNACSQTRYLV